jgi:Endonuclease/Exonuclease/phosphatase family
MKNMFFKDQFALDSIEKVKSLEKIITKQHPHILGIVEASDKTKHHQYLIDNTKLVDLGYKVGKSDLKRGKQDLVVYYREPFEILTVDDDIEFYEQWAEDIDQDGIKELCEFERKPLEVLFRLKGTDITILVILVILVATKSKGVFSVNDIINHQYLALANRKKLLAQSKKIRSRVNQLMDEQPELPLIIMGDFNDEPGMDSYERALGASSIETVMGSVFEPGKILHNTMWHLSKIDRKIDLWTTEYPDLIVQNFGLHKAWLDHIFISPNMLTESAKFKYMMNSGDIIPKDADAKRVSDHYAVYCKFKV